MDQPGGGDKKVAKILLSVRGQLKNRRKLFFSLSPSAPEKKLVSRDDGGSAVGPVQRQPAHSPHSSQAVERGYLACWLPYVESVRT